MPIKVGRADAELERERERNDGFIDPINLLFGFGCEREKAAISGKSKTNTDRPKWPRYTHDPNSQRLQNRKIIDKRTMAYVLGTI